MKKTQAIPQDDLVKAWEVLTKMRANFNPPGKSQPTGTGWNTITEALRLVEMEVRAQYGTEAWKMLKEHG